MNYDGHVLDKIETKWAEKATNISGLHNHNPASLSSKHQCLQKNYFVKMVGMMSQDNYHDLFVV